MSKNKDLNESFENVVKTQDLKRDNKADVFVEHDLAIGIMNLIAIEEHLFFTGAKTQKTYYYDMINDIRNMRKELLKKIIKEYEGEIWCTSKHLLTASMRMMEVGTKEQTLGNNEEAYSFFEKSYNLYMMFWVLNSNQDDKSLKVEDFINKNTNNNIVEKIQNIANVFTSSKEENVKNNNKINQNIEKRKFSLSGIKNFISEKLDCCRE